MFAGFLSHDWGKDELRRDNHSRVKSIFMGLKEMSGLKFWLDEEQLQANLVDGMCAGIDQSEVVLVFVTKAFMNKVNGSNGKFPEMNVKIYNISKIGDQDNCMKEFRYASFRKGKSKLLPIVKEPRMKNTKEWTGAFLMEMVSELYVDFSDDENYKVKVANVLQALRRKTENRKNIDVSVIKGNALKVNFDPFAICRQKAREYVPKTRVWAINRILEWISSPTWTQRVFVFMGCAGIGKSVLLARLCQLGEAIGDEATRKKRYT